MKALVGMLFAAISMGSVVATSSPAIAQDQKLAVTKIESAKETEPAIVEIVVTLENGSRVTLRMDVFTMQDLVAQLKHIGM